MPYRRLPATYTTRIEALRIFADIKQESATDNSIISQELLNNAEQSYRMLENALNIYKQATDRQQNSNHKYRKTLAELEAHILNFVESCQQKCAEGLFDEQSFSCYGIEKEGTPDLSTEQKTLDLAQKLQKGERERIMKGGMPMTNPTISNVSIFHDKMIDVIVSQKTNDNFINHTRKKLKEESDKADVIIKDLWDTIESTHSHLPADKKIEECKKYGIIYYKRSSEKKKQKDNLPTQEMPFKDIVKKAFAHSAKDSVIFPTKKENAITSYNENSSQEINIVEIPLKSQKNKKETKHKCKKDKESNNLPELPFEW
ncbi:MAG: hypothetical protein CSA89_00265 [Bacteroidales bacterium]|nr:MAG: hypothetical protein CSA89_00265 [Bacteroidales bacterium]